MVADAALVSHRAARGPDRVRRDRGAARRTRVERDELTRIYEVELDAGIAARSGSTARRCGRSRGTSAASTSSCSRPRISRCRAARRATAGGSSTARCSTCGPTTSSRSQDYEKVLKQRNAVLQASRRRAWLRAAGRRAARGLRPPARAAGGRRSRTRAPRSSRRCAAALRDAFRRDHAHRHRAERALRVEDRRAQRRRDRRASARDARARPRDRSRRSAARTATTSRSSSTSRDAGDVRVAGPAARDHARVEDRGARAARARRTAICRSCCSMTCRASSIRSATNTCSSTSRRRPVSASSRPLPRAMFCCPETVPITASKMARFPREIRHMIPFCGVRMCYSSTSDSRVLEHGRSHNNFADFRAGVRRQLDRRPEGPRRRSQAPRHVHRRHR